MTKTFKYLSVICLLVVLAISCKDEEDPEPTKETPKTNTDFLVEGNWEMQSGVINPSIEVDIFGTTVTIGNYWELLGALNGGVAQPCFKDNLMLFFRDSSVTLDEGPSKCDAADPQEQDGGDWMFLNNETSLAFTSFPYDPLMQERVLEIISLNSAEMKLKMDYKFAPPGGDSTDHVINLEFKNVK
jgi:hypothetical protein